MSKDLLLERSRSLCRKRPAKRQYGMASCESPPDGPGVVTVFVHHADTGVVVSLDESSVKLSLPEEHVRALVPVLTKVLDRIAQLRGEDQADKGAPETNPKDSP